MYHIDTIPGMLFKQSVRSDAMVGLAVGNSLTERDVQVRNSGGTTARSQTIYRRKARRSEGRRALDRLKAWNPKILNGGGARHRAAQRRRKLTIFSRANS